MRACASEFMRVYAIPYCASINRKPALRVKSLSFASALVPQGTQDSHKSTNKLGLRNLNFNVHIRLMYIDAHTTPQIYVGTFRIQIWVIGG